MSLDAFPRYPLLFGPSPVHPLERLAAHLGGAQLWATGLYAHLGGQPALNGYRALFS
jgi:1-aminocyclopropane-1-carboxylate deaminase/D-cysteine desulfhydrase-like pyridoxal-dependent ACC family enzyme